MYTTALPPAWGYGSVAQRNTTGRKNISLGKKIITFPEHIHQSYLQTVSVGQFGIAVNGIKHLFCENKAVPCYSHTQPPCFSSTTFRVPGLVCHLLWCLEAQTSSKWKSSALSSWVQLCNVWNPWDTEGGCTEQLRNSERTEKWKWEYSHSVAVTVTDHCEMSIWLFHM